MENPTFAGNYNTPIEQRTGWKLSGENSEDTWLFWQIQAIICKHNVNNFALSPKNLVGKWSGIAY